MSNSLPALSGVGKSAVPSTDHADDSTVTTAADRASRKIAAHAAHAQHTTTSGIDQHDNDKLLTKRAITELKSAVAAGMQTLTLAPLYAWSKKHQIKIKAMQRLLLQHGLVKLITKGNRRLVPIQARKISDPSVLQFLQEAEKWVIKNNPYSKQMAKAKNKAKKITRADRKYRRKFGHSEAEDEGATGAGAIGESTYDTVDRKMAEHDGMDSTKADSALGPGDKR